MISMQDYVKLTCSKCQGPYYVKRSYIELTSLSKTEYLGGWCPYCGSNLVKQIED